MDDDDQSSFISWLSRDAKLIIIARALRILARSSISVLLAIYLSKIGFSLIHIGLFFSFGLAGSAFLASTVGLIAGKVGQRRLLVAFTLVDAISGLSLIYSRSFPLLAVFAFLGSITGTAGMGPFGPLYPLEQASLAGTVSPQRRIHLFALLGIIVHASSAVGVLAAALPDFFYSSLGFSELASYQMIIAFYVVILSISAIIYFLLSSSVEVSAQQQRWTNPFRLPSRRLIFTLTGLFCIDRFSGSMIVQSLVAYWFATKFNIKIHDLAIIFFFADILRAFSMWLSARIANRIGLLKTMVFTHIPSNIFLIAAAISPFGWLAIAFWQLYSLVGSMDTPARDSYTMAIVKPEERVAMASIHVTGGSIAGAAGPSFASALWSTFSASVPFFVAGIIKICYDLSLYAIFRDVKPLEEAREYESKIVS